MVHIKNGKRILSLALCLLMLVGMFPVSAFAAEGEGTAEPPVEQTTQTPTQTPAQETPTEPSAGDTPADPSVGETSTESQQPADTTAAGTQPETSPAPSQAPADTHKHSGGKASCTALAVCDGCKQPYGDYGHEGGSATCTTPAVCTLCKQAYGALAEHTYGEDDKCTACSAPKPIEQPAEEPTGDPADEEATGEEPVCTCGEFCDGMNFDCSVCAEDFGLCTYYVPACYCAEKCTEDNFNEFCDVCSLDYTACKGENVSAQALAAGETYSVTFNVYDSAEDITFSGAASAVQGTDYTFTITANEKYSLGDYVSISINNVYYTAYENLPEDSFTATIPGNAITGPITIHARFAPRTYAVSVSDNNLTLDSTQATYNTVYSAKLTPAAGYALPKTITVTCGGTTLTADTDYTYYPSSGSIEIGADAVKGDIVITASATAIPKYNVKLTGSGLSVSTESLQGEEFLATVTPGTGYALPNTIEVKAGGVSLGSASYEWNTQYPGSLRISRGTLYLSETEGYKAVEIIADGVAGSFSVEFQGTNVSLSSGTTANAATAGTDYTATLKAAEGYVLPDNITVACGTNPLTSPNWYAYDKGTGSLTIYGKGINDNVTINAVGEAIPNQPVSVTLYEGVERSLELIGSTTATTGRDYTAKVAAKPGYTLPEYLAIVCGSTELRSNDPDSSPYKIEYDNQTGEFTVKGEQITSNLVIKSFGDPIPYNVTFEGENINFTGEDTADVAAYYATLSAAYGSGYILPESIVVTVGGETLQEDTDYTYTCPANRLEAGLIINSGVILGDVVIQAEGVVDDCDVQFEDDSDVSVLTLDGAATAIRNKDYTARIIPQAGYAFDKVEVSSGDGILDSGHYAWSSGTGKLTIFGRYITGPVTIRARAVEAYYTVTFRGTGVTSDGVSDVNENADYEVTLTPEPGYVLPDTITVTVGTTTPENSDSGYHYDSSTGELLIPGLLINGNIEITAVGDHVHDYTYAAQRNVITESCSYDFCDHAETATLTAQNATYNGAAYTGAKVVFSADWAGDAPTYVIKQGEATLDGSLTNAGSYTASGTIGEGDSAVTAKASFTIAKAKLTVTANNCSIIYGEAPPSDFTVKYEGFVNSETESVLSGSLEYEYNYTKGNDVGNYTITPKGLSSGNYDITFVPGTLTVTQADPSYSYTGTLTATYGQTLADVALTGGTGNGTWSWAEDTDTPVGNVGAQTHKARFTPKDTKNYKTVTGIEISVVVGKAEPTYTVPTGLTATYGQTLDAVTLPAGWAWKDTESSVGNAGSNDFTAVFTPTDTENYKTLEKTLSITVSPRPITVTPDSKLSKAYGEEDPTLTYQVTEGTMVGSDALNGKLSRAAGENVGEYAITIGTLANPNYAITFTDGVKFSITAFELTADNTTLTVSDKVYTGSQLVGLDSISFDDDMSLTDGTDYEITGSTGTAVGSYTVKLTGKGNYTGSVEAPWKITPPAILANVTNGTVTANNATLDQLEELKLLEEALSTVTNETEATDAEKAQWAEAEEKLPAIIEALEELEELVNSEDIKAVEDISADNVTVDDKDALESAKADIEKLLDDYSGNLGTETTKELEDKLEVIEKSLEALEAVEDLIAEIEKWLKDNKDKFDADELKLREEYQDFMDDIDDLDENSQRIVKDAVGKELEAAKAKLYTYKITSGSGANWVKGSGVTLDFTANGDISLFDYLLIDGKLLDAKNYTLSSGSTIVKLKADYLQNLSTGKHTIQFVYDDGKTDVGSFNVVYAWGSPRTGDDSNIGLWMSLMLMSVLGIGTVLLSAKKRKAEK